jgi:hypothetical protein
MPSQQSESTLSQTYSTLVEHVRLKASPMAQALWAQTVGVLAPQVTWHSSSTKSAQSVWSQADMQQLELMVQILSTQGSSARQAESSPPETHLLWLHEEPVATSVQVRFT